MLIKEIQILFLNLCKKFITLFLKLIKNMDYLEIFQYHIYKHGNFQGDILFYLMNST